MQQILLSILPVIILLIYIYRKDKYEKEPLKLLAKAFFFGILSAVATLIVLLPFSVNYFYNLVSPTIYIILESFLFAAIPEETLKFLFLFILIWRNKEFNEYMDGIVYAVFVSMGFACFENILYLYDSSTLHAITRGIFSVPGHFLNAVVMGYYFSLAKFSNSKILTIIYLIVGLVLAIMMHGIFNSILGFKDFVVDINSLLGKLVFVLFVIFDIIIWKIAIKKIEKYQKV